MAHKGELLIPSIAANDPNGVEVIRAWVAEKRLHVSLAPEVWKDPSAWGIALADIVRHLADAYSQTQGIEQKDTVQRIFSLLCAELDTPTDTPTGGFVEN